MLVAPMNTEEMIEVSKARVLRIANHSKPTLFVVGGKLRVAKTIDSTVEDEVLDAAAVEFVKKWNKRHGKSKQRRGGRKRR